METVQVKVTNKNDFEIEERYDGILYRLKPGKSVNIPKSAACHIFGTDFEGGRTDRNEIFQHLGRRWGWNRSKKKDDPEYKDPKQMFDNISFEVVHMSLIETPEGEEQEVLKTPRKGGRFLNKEEAA